MTGNIDKTILTIGTKSYKQNDFADYLSSTQRKREPENITMYVDKMYSTFVDDCLVKYENGQLETKYPEFKNLINEYRDGILLFDLTDQKVWSKAVKDTVGLKAFYQKNKQNYMWDKRVSASIYTVTDAGIVGKIKMLAGSGTSDAEILKQFNTDSLKIVTIESGKFSRKDNKIIDSLTWNKGLSGDIRINEATGFVYIRKVLKPEPKELNEARGLITADYQNYLEKEWIASLRAKYPVIVNKEVLAKIK